MILESLLAHFKSKSIEYLNFGTASFDLIYRLRQYSKVLLIDGIDAGLEPGECKIFDLEKIKYHLKASPVSSHELNLKGLFELYKKLKIESKIYVAGIQIKDVSFGEGLAPELSAKRVGALKKILRFIDTQLLLAK